MYRVDSRSILFVSQTPCKILRVYAAGRFVGADHSPAVVTTLAAVAHLLGDGTWGSALAEVTLIRR